MCLLFLHSLHCGRRYSTDTARLDTITATLERLSYTGEAGPSFLPASWPDNGATDVAGEIDIILKCDLPPHPLPFDRSHYSR